MPEWISWFADALGILGAFFAFKAWMQSRTISTDLQKEKLRQARKIRVELTNGGRSIAVPVEFKRSEFARAEIQGRLGVIPMKKKGDRYSIEFLNTPEFLRRIEEISNSDGDSLLTIPITDKELAQFDI